MMRSVDSQVMARKAVSIYMSLLLLLSISYFIASAPTIEQQAYHLKGSVGLFWLLLFLDVAGALALISLAWRSSRHVYVLAFVYFFWGLLFTCVNYVAVWSEHISLGVAAGTLSQLTIAVALYCAVMALPMILLWITSRKIPNKKRRASVGADK